MIDLPKLETTQDEVTYMMRDSPGRCQCTLCTRTKHFGTIINMLNEWDQRWMLSFYDSVVETEEWNGMLDEHNKELRKRITELRQQLAEARRRSELLRAVAISAKSLFNENLYVPLSEWHIKLMQATQAALDGGALVGTGEGET